MKPEDLKAALEARRDEMAIDNALEQLYVLAGNLGETTNE